MESKKSRYKDKMIEILVLSQRDSQPQLIGVGKFNLSEMVNGHKNEGHYNLLLEQCQDAEAKICLEICLKEMQNPSAVISDSEPDI